MTDRRDQEIDGVLATWVATLSHDEVVRRYRALSADERQVLEEQAWDDVRRVLDSGEPYGDRFESLARRFEVFAEAAPSLSAEIFLRTAHDLRHPDEWRASQASQHRHSEGRLQALALASSCWADEPDDVRLRRIEEVLPQLKQLADEAVAERRFEDESAIGEDIVGLWRLRDALQARS